MQAYTKLYGQSYIAVAVQNRPSIKLLVGKIKCSNKQKFKKIRKIDFFPTNPFKNEAKTGYA
jgi:hypothetical protein